MPLFFKDRIPDPIHGENARYYDATANNGTVKLSDFKLVLKNNIPPEKSGDPVSAGNLNYASGNVMLPANSPEDTHKGDLMSLTPDGVVPAQTKRSVSATGLDYSTSQLSYGFLRLSDTKLLLMHRDRAVVATVDFNNRAVALGEYRNYVTNSNHYTLGNGVMLRDYGDHPTALFGAILNDRSAATTAGYFFFPAVYSITGDVISAFGRGYNFASSHTYITSPVRAGTGSMLICTSNGTTYTYASLFNCETGTVSLTSQVQIPGVTYAEIYQTLFSYDRSNGKYILIYKSLATATLNNIYAVTITVSGNSMSFGSPQFLGDTSDTVFPSGSTYISGGTHCCSDCGGKILAIANSASGDGPSRFQILSVSPSGAVTKGDIQNLPLYNLCSNAIITSNTYGSSCLSYCKNGKIYLSGADRENSPVDACLLEFTINGVNAEIKKFKPYQNLGITSGSPANLMKNAFYENPNNPDDFLFMQQGNAAPFNKLAFWFGRRTDYARPNNIIGIAIDDPENGFVRVQTSGKNLPGLFSGLRRGKYYTAGENGSILPIYGETVSSASKIVGIATGDDSLQFFGSSWWQ